MALPLHAVPAASLMAQECRSAPERVAALLAQDEGLYAALGRRLRDAAPSVVATIARGSSDHAAHHLAYLVMLRLGLLSCSLPMSLVTLYNSPLRAQGVFSVALSQSGQSPDLIAPTDYLRQGGATTVAIVNDAESPLARAAEVVLPLHAGPERSVAATKSYIAQLVAGARLVAHWQHDHALLDALQALPEALERALQQDWSAAVPKLQAVNRLFVIARGPALAVAEECALKFKETCAISAEAFSGAELKHGPMALIEPGFAALVLAPRGPAQAGLVELAAQLGARGATVLLASTTAGADLPLATTAEPQLDAIAVVQSFYPMVEQLARARGFDPDHPRHLSKVTRTQ